MRYTLITAAVLLATASNSRSAVASFTAPSATVGRNLETSVLVRLPQANSHAEIIVTVSSDDPKRLLIADGPEKAGSPKITITIPANKFQRAPEVWLQGLAGSGLVTYTITAGDMGTAKGKVTLAPSAIVITGPFRAPKFSTTPRSAPAHITLTSAALDKTGKVIEDQAVAGGSDLEVTIDSSNASAGKLRDSKLVLHGGSNNAATYFEPAGEGEATMIPVQPRGFIAAKQYASVVAVVAKPGIAVVDDVVIGKDLQLVGTLCLGEPAPAGGLEVTITSGDPAKLILSPGPDVTGSGSVKIKVPEGQLIAPISLQALADSGDVSYEATAPGFRTRAAKIGLARSGVIVAYDPYGPPDEASVLRKAEIADERSFQVSMTEAEKHPVKLVVWTAHLDRESGRAADITVQPLRPGVETTVILTTSDPAVASVDSELTIKAGSSHAVSRFTPRSKGKTVISIDTPKGFSTPKNATKVPATVTE